MLKESEGCKKCYKNDKEYYYRRETSWMKQNDLAVLLFLKHGLKIMIETNQKYIRHCSKYYIHSNSFNLHINFILYRFCSYPILQARKLSYKRTLITSQDHIIPGGKIVLLAFITVFSSVKWHK